MLLLTKKEVKSLQHTNVFYIYGNRILKLVESKNYPIALHNGLNYNYHFIIIELANEFVGQV